MRIPHPVTAAAAAIAVITMLACGGTSSAPSDGSDAGAKNEAPAGEQVATVKVGEAVTIKSFGAEYTVTVRDLKTGVKPGNQFTQPSNGQFIVFEAEIAVKEGSLFASPAMFGFQTSQGTVYSWALAVIDGVDQDWSVELNAGQNKTGKVIMDVPTDITGGKIYVQALDKPAGYWTV